MDKKQSTAPTRRVSPGPEWDVTMPMVQNLDGRWVPSIPPTPVKFGFRRCPKCKGRFRTLADYEGHYAIYHILRLREE